MLISTEPTSAVSPQSSQKHILLVEDDVTLVPLWKAVVKRLDCQCQMAWVASESAAVKKIEQKSSEGKYFDAIVCDIFLSGNRTGLDLWQTYKDSSSKFIFASGVAEEKFRKHFTGNLSDQGELVYYIQKPLDPKTCRMIVEHALLGTRTEKPLKRRGQQFDVGL